LLLASCDGGKKEYITLDLNFTCTPIQYFDTLKNVLLTNNKGDLTGQSDILENLLSGERVYKKNLPKKGGHFYIDSVEKKEYWLLFADGKFSDVFFSGYARGVDFSGTVTDTLKFDLCVESNVQVGQ
jgi:hypothetical protein